MFFDIIVSQCVYLRLRVLHQNMQSISDRSYLLAHHSYWSPAFGSRTAHI